MDLNGSFPHYRRIAKKHQGFLVLVGHKRNPNLLTMMGGKLPESYEDAVDAAEDMIASGHFVSAAVVQPSGEIMVRIPGLRRAYVEDTDL